MRGTVYKRGNTWTVVYDEGQDEHGKRLQRSKGGFHTRRDADKFLTDTLARIGDGSYSTPSKLTVADYLTREWLPAIEATVRPSTFQQYRSVIRNRIIPRIGHLRLQALSGGQVNALYLALDEAGLSPASRRQTHAVLHRACRDAVRWGRLIRSPVAAADPPAADDSRRITAWTATDLARFLNHLREDRLFGLWRLAATTGMRRGELLGLTWFNTDLNAGTVRIDQQLVAPRGGLSLGPPKSKRSRRTIALDTETVDTLHQHRETQLLERAVASDVYHDQDLVFCNELGQPIYPQRLTETFLKRRGTAGIPTGTLHVLRHRRDPGADKRRPAPRRLSQTWRPAGDGAPHLRAPAAAIGCGGGRTRGCADRALAPREQTGRKPAWLSQSARRAGSRRRRSPRRCRRRRRS